jgi:hypothetical protein
MRSSRRGLSQLGEIGVIALVIIVAVAAYVFVPPLVKGGGGSQTTTSLGGPNPIADTTHGIFPLVTTFKDLTLVLDVNDESAQYSQNSTYAYTVLGKGTLNSTQYTRVEFSTLGETHFTVAWYNSTGGLGRLDVVGLRNYTGTEAALDNLPYIQTYVNAFYTLISISNNATLNALLTKTSQASGSIGSTKVNLATYTLETRTASISKATERVASIPGTNIAMMVYLSEKLSDGSTYLFQVTTLTR